MAAVALDDALLSSVPLEPTRHSSGCLSHARAVAAADSGLMVFTLCPSGACQTAVKLPGSRVGGRSGEGSWEIVVLSRPFSPSPSLRSGGGPTLRSGVGEIAYS